MIDKKIYNQVKISIIIPIFNRSHIVENTIESILKNKNKSYEIILVDDGSTDNLKKKITNKYFNQIKYLEIKNSERGFARNYGAKFAKGEYFNFFDSDDFCLDNHIETALDIINKYSKPEIFHLSFNFKELNQIKPRKIEGYINNRILKKNICSCNGVFIRADIFHKNNFNEDRVLSGVEDWDLWLRLSKKFNFYSSPIITSIIINHENRSMNSNNFEKLSSRFDLLLKNLGNKDYINLSTKELKYIRSELFSFQSLYFSNQKNLKNLSIMYFLKSIYSSPFKFFNIRNIIIFKNWIIT